MTTAEQGLAVTLTSPRIARKPEFIDLNDLERMDMIKAVCRYSTGIKHKVALGRCYDDEYHLIKDWFALIPNAEAKAFAEWLLDLARRDWDRQFAKEYS